MKNSPQVKQNTDAQLDDLITFSQAAQISGLTDRHLRHLAMTGELWARKLGRNWFTTSKAIQEYLSLGKRPGPKPQHK